MVLGISRRSFVLGLALAINGWVAFAADVEQRGVDARRYASIYGPISDPPFRIRALNLAAIDQGVLRREVAYRGAHPPGTVIINIAQRRLYLVESGGRALRFGIGVGRARALNFRGSAVIGRKAKWPSWRPTANMIRRIPKYAAYADGMRGGPNNPLGARALYLYRDGVDTFFRVHGTNEPESIGRAVSSGCIRLFNHDIIFLHDRVDIGTPVIVESGTVPQT
jgi:lipoprotein-anchoring transpeptidase ErfK/SrfK